MGQLKGDQKRTTDQIVELSKAIDKECARTKVGLWSLVPLFIMCWDCHLMLSNLSHFPGYIEGFSN